MLSLLAGNEFRRIGNSAQRGPEWHGPCPVCGGHDRFHVWPEQGQGGSFWCRACGKGGDLIEFYRWRDGLSYREACARAGATPRQYSRQAALSMPKAPPPAPAFVPSASTQVNPIWSQHAAKFAEWCHEQLLQNPQQLAWLAVRGIDGGQAKKFALGFNPKDAYRPRAAWGLPPRRKPDGGEAKLWLPAGLVIPQVIDDQVARLRIRRPAGEPKYYVVPGSGREPLVTNPAAIAHVIVESELDAILLDGLAGDMPVGAIAMGNASAKPTAACHAVLQRAVHLSISLDSDQPRTNPTSGKAESPGAQAARWWLQTYPQAERVPVIGGKDPGDAYKAGVDVRTWLLAGLPPRFRFQRTEDSGQKTEDSGQKTEDSGQKAEDGGRKTENLSSASCKSRLVTLTSGLEFHVTDDKQTWDDLTDAGELVFSVNELARLHEATSSVGVDALAANVATLTQIKRVFSGAYIRAGRAGLRYRACGMATNYQLCPLPVEIANG